MSLRIWFHFGPWVVHGETAQASQRWSPIGMSSHDSSASTACWSWGIQFHGLRDSGHKAWCRWCTSSRCSFGTCTEGLFCCLLFGAFAKICHHGRQPSSPKKNTSEPYTVQPSAKGKGRGQGNKGGKSSGSNAAPKGYNGCVGRDAKNRPICFDYNIAGCNNKALAGGSCAQGRHVCFRGGCFKTHSFQEAHGADVEKAPEWLHADGYEANQGSHAVVLELFCGTAGLSASLKRLGLDVIAVDKIVARSPKVMVTKVDLTQYAIKQLVLEWIQLPQVRAVFLAPPCGQLAKHNTTGRWGKFASSFEHLWETRRCGRFDWMGFSESWTIKYFVWICRRMLWSLLPAW